MEQRYDEHYIRSITQMGDTQNVVTSQAIFTTRKIKLIEKGVRVNSALFERLVSHKLIPKIDHCLAVENGISRERINLKTSVSGEQSGLKSGRLGFSRSRKESPDG